VQRVKSVALDHRHWKTGRMQRTTEGAGRGTDGMQTKNEEITQVSKSKKESKMWRKGSLTLSILA